MSDENWKAVVGYEGRYEVSDMGRVRSLPRRYKRRSQILKPSRRIGGYMRVTLCEGPDKQQLLISRLVLTAFRGPCPAGQETRHLNGVRSDNRLGNLAWGTKLENADDKRRHGTMCHGEKHGRAKLTEDDVREIRRLHKIGMRQVDLAEIFGIRQSKISSAIIGKTWAHI